LLEDRGKIRKPVSGWPVTGPSGCTLTSNQQCANKNTESSKYFRHMSIVSLLKPSGASQTPFTDNLNRRLV